MEDFETDSDKEREELSQTDRLGCNALGETSLPEKLTPDVLETHRKKTKRTFRYVNSKLVNQF